MKGLMLNGSFNPDGSTKAGLDITAGTLSLPFLSVFAGVHHGHPTVTHDVV